MVSLPETAETVLSKNKLRNPKRTKKKFHGVFFGRQGVTREGLRVSAPFVGKWFGKKSKVFRSLETRYMGP